MKIKFKTLLALVLFVVVSFNIFLPSISKGESLFPETEHGVMNLTEAAYGFYKENGIQKAISAFNDNPLFRSGSLYVFAVDKSGTLIAHGDDKSLIGKDITKFVDIAGKEFGEDILKVKGSEWVDYYWINSAVNRVQKKRTYVISDGDIHICVGLFVSE